MGGPQPWLGQEHPQASSPSLWGGGLGDISDSGLLRQGLCAASTHHRSFPTTGWLSPPSGAGVQVSCPPSGAWDTALVAGSTKGHSGAGGWMCFKLP